EAALYASIVTGDLLVEPLGQRDWVRTHQLVETYADLPLGGTDASLVAVAERLGITRVATLDHTRFRAVSPGHCAALDLLPCPPDPFFVDMCTMGEANFTKKRGGRSPGWPFGGMRTSSD